MGMTTEDYDNKGSIIYGEQTGSKKDRSNEITKIYFYIFYFKHLGKQKRTLLARRVGQK